MSAAGICAQKEIKRNPFLFAADKYFIWFITMYNEQVSVLCCLFYLFFILYEFYKALSTGSDDECIGLNSLALVSIPFFHQSSWMNIHRSRNLTHTQASLIVSMHPDLLIVGRMHAT